MQVTECPSLGTGQAPVVHAGPRYRNTQSAPATQTAKHTTQELALQHSEARPCTPACCYFAPWQPIIFPTAPVSSSRSFTRHVVRLRVSRTLSCVVPLPNRHAIMQTTATSTTPQ